jgi:hypothetical protein
VYKFDTNTNKTQLVHAYLDPDVSLSERKRIE